MLEAGRVAIAAISDFFASPESQGWQVPVVLAALSPLNCDILAALLTLEQ
jgi:hypothetical protein